MEKPVFKLPRVGLVGGKPVDRTYMETIMARAKQLAAACRDTLSEQVEEIDTRQLSLPFPAKPEKRANEELS